MAYNPLLRKRRGIRDQQKRHEGMNPEPCYSPTQNAECQLKQPAKEQVTNIWFGNRTAGKDDIVCSQVMEYITRNDAAKTEKYNGALDT
jgi:hypothetical protein